MRPSDRIILLLGSELANQTSLRLEFQTKGFVTEVANSEDEQLALGLYGGVTLVATEVDGAATSNFRFLSRIRKARPDLPLILTAGRRSAATSIEAARLNAQLVLRPFNIKDFVDLVCNAANNTSAQQQCDRTASNGGAVGFIGFGAVMELLYKEIGRAAATSWSVLITGATGTGKELVAREIHNRSGRADHPFVAVNCCAIPESLFESELFGHDPGAFTGARSRRIGCFEQAQKGTVFLDEIGDLNLPTQAKLLRVLEEKQVRRLGGYKDIAVDVRVLAATNRDLEKRIAAGEFREDLFYRLAVCTINTPELREHSEDIPALAEHFLACAADEIGCDMASFDPEAVAFLTAQPWPGNVRQLQNVIRRAALVTWGQTIRIKDVEQAYGGRAAAADSNETVLRHSDLLVKAESGEISDVLSVALKQTESALFKETFAFAGGNLTKGARLLGVGRTTFRLGLQQLGLLTPNVTSGLEHRNSL